MRVGQLVNPCVKAPAFVEHTKKAIPTQIN